MLMKNKVLKFSMPLELKEVDDDDGSVTIVGHASTNDIDRSDDIVTTEAWTKSGALKNYLKNPIVLAFHDMARPIGKTIDHEVDEKGLKITAKISKAAGDILELIKEGILSALSIGFMIKDADFDPDSGVFVIKDLELFEVSVVSVPANQNALFSIAKNFDSSEDYKKFRNQFIKSESEETLMVDTTTDKAKDKPIDIAALATQISLMVKGDLDDEKKAKEDAEKAEKEAIAKIEATAVTASERLIKDLREELVEKDGQIATALADVKESLTKLSESGELEAAFSAKNNSQHRYSEKNGKGFEGLTDNMKDGMFYASKILGIKVEETKAFKDYVLKSGMEHWDSGVVGEWEDEYSTRIENALREQLVVEPLFTTIPMATETLNMPINPEAGDATWVHSAAYRSSINPADEVNANPNESSSGDAQNHELLEQTIIARKLATREYVGYEEEEDSIVALAPVINDAVARRMSRASDLAFLRGAGVLTNDSSYDPILGIEGRGANTTDVTIAGGAGWEANVSEDVIADLRRNLGLYGLDPTQLTFLCSHDLYYEFMKIQEFKQVNTYGPLATVHVGEVGSIFGVRVLVSQMFDNAAITTGTSGTTLGIMVYPRNFITGILRGLMTEADKDIINQKRVIVSSRRFGFQDIITGEATVNLQITS